MLKDAPRKKMSMTNDLPPEILDQVNRLLVEEVTYEEIRDFLAEQGYEISKTSVGRYGREFLESCRRLRIHEEKSRALAPDEESALILEEAASRLFALRILESLLSGEVDLSSMPRLLSDFVRLQSSNVQREKLRREFRTRTEKAAQEAARCEGGGGLSDRTAEEIRRKILGIME